MFSNKRKMTAMALILLFSAVASADEPGPEDWDRRLALNAAATVDHEPTVATLIDLTYAGSTPEVMALLERTRTRNDWPSPARENTIFKFANALRTLPSRSVADEVMTYLKAYPVAVLVAHEDHPRAQVPLFNIRAVAFGTQNRWTRQEALLEGLALLAANPSSLNDAFLVEDAPAVRGGYLMTLERADPVQLLEIARDAAKRLPNNPELTPLAGAAALRARDLNAMNTVLTRGVGPGRTHMLRDASKLLHRKEATELLMLALGDGPGTGAGLAIAELGPSLADDPVVLEALLAAVPDQLLGAGAAFALALSHDPGARAALADLAARSDDPTSRRAAAALAIAPDAGPERRP